MNDSELFPPIDTFPYEVDGNELLSELAESSSRFLTLPEHGETILTLWTVFTYAIEAAEHSPILAITAPEKRCGKTTALTWLGKLVNRQLNASNITAQALYRTIECHEPTLLIDEADTFIGENNELRGVLNAGHSRNGAVIRLVGSDHTPKSFKTFCPKAIAMIGQLPDTLADRSIHMQMRRRLPHESIESMRDQERHFDLLKQKIAKFISDNIVEIKAVKPFIPPSLNDRATDNWYTLLSIAEYVGEDWAKKARLAASSFADAEEDSTGINEELLTDIQTVFKEAGVDRMQSTMLIEKLCAVDEAPWETWNRGKPMTSRQFAKRLRGFGITVNQTIRLGRNTCKGYLLEQFKDSFARYIPSQSVTESQVSEYGVYSLDAISNMNQDVTDNKSLNPNDYNGCDRVTDKYPVGLCQRCGGEGCGYCG